MTTRVHASSSRTALRRAALLLVLWTVPAAFMVLQMHASALMNGTPRPVPASLVPAIAEWLIWAPLTPVVVVLLRRFPLVWPPSITAVVAHGLGICAASFVRAVVYACATIFVTGTVSPDVLPSYVWRLAVVWTPIAAVVYGAIAAGAAALESARRLRERDLAAAELREQLARAELAALRARVHPHFLFNALHSLGALMRAGRNADAVRATADLSAMLRDVLAHDAPESVCLEDELAFVRRYLAIEQVRFSDRLRVQWEIDPETRTAIVPSLLVQPLVENAVRHGISASLSAGVLRIRSCLDGNALVVEVSDDGPGLHSRTAGPGVGLDAVHTRLRRTYGPAASVTLERGPVAGTVARVRVPWRCKVTTGTSISPQRTPSAVVLEEVR